MGEAAPEVAVEERPDAVAVVALAQAGNGGIDGDDQHRIAGALRAGEGRFGDAAAARDVELVPQRPRRAGRDFLEPCARERRQDVSRASGVRGACGVYLAARVEHAAEADWRKQE